MAAQGEREPGGLGMCSWLDPMARDGTPFYNLNPRGSSTPFTEHGLGRQMESHNGGAIASRRGMEQAAIISATNGTTWGECFQQSPLQTTWAWHARQADIGRLREELREEWRTELEKQKRKHDLEVKKLKGEVEEGIQKRNEELMEKWKGRWKKANEILEHRRRERELQNELLERKTTENKMLEDHAEQIEAEAGN